MRNESNAQPHGINGNPDWWMLGSKKIETCWIYGRTFRLEKDMVGTYCHRTSHQCTISLGGDVNCILRRCSSKWPTFTPHTKNRLCIWFVKHNKQRVCSPQRPISICSYSLLLRAQWRRRIKYKLACPNLGPDAYSTTLEASSRTITRCGGVGPYEENV